MNLMMLFNKAQAGRGGTDGSLSVTRPAAARRPVEITLRTQYPFAGTADASVRQLPIAFKTLVTHGSWNQVTQTLKQIRMCCTEGIAWAHRALSAVRCAAVRRSAPALTGRAPPLKTA